MSCPPRIVGPDRGSNRVQDEVGDVRKHDHSLPCALDYGAQERKSSINGLRHQACWWPRRTPRPNKNAHCNIDLHLNLPPFPKVLIRQGCTPMRYV